MGYFSKTFPLLGTLLLLISSEIFARDLAGTQESDEGEMHRGYGHELKHGAGHKQAVTCGKGMSYAHCIRTKGGHGHGKPGHGAHTRNGKPGHGGHGSADETAQVGAGDGN